MSDPYEAGPPEYRPDEEPGDDDQALFAGAAADQDDQEADDRCYCMGGVGPHPYHGTPRA